MPHGGPAPSGTFPVDLESPMYGHLLLSFRPQDVGVDPEAIPKNDRDGEWSSTQHQEVVRLLNASSALGGFKVANSYGQDGHLTYEGSSFIGRINLQLDPRCGRLFVEERSYAGKEFSVELHAWVSVDRTRSDRLVCGAWSNEDKTVGVKVVNDPSKDDRNRMHVFVVAPTIVAAREALLAALEGAKRPEKPWIV